MRLASFPGFMERDYGETIASVCFVQCIRKAYTLCIISIYPIGNILKKQKTTYKSILPVIKTSIQIP